MRKVLFIHLVIRLLVSLNKFILTDGCRNDQFECNNTLCINITLRCNNNFDCHDYSDELNCSTIGVCPEGLYKCDSGQCINAGDLCDGINNCPDGTDERNCGGTTLYNNVSESSSNHNYVFMSSTPNPSKTILSIMSTTTITVKPLETSSSSMALPTPESSLASRTSSRVSNNMTTPTSNYTPDDRGTKYILIAVIVSVSGVLLAIAMIVVIRNYINKGNSGQDSQSSKTMKMTEL